MRIQSHTEHAAAHKPKSPLLTFMELADEFGLPYQKLANLLSKSPTAPKPWASYQGTAVGPRKTYYESKAMRDWWAAHNAAKERA